MHAFDFRSYAALKPLGSLSAAPACRAETDAVLVRAGVAWQPFSEGALTELPQVQDASQWSIPPAELATRRDLRGPEQFVCSIDPPGQPCRGEHAAHLQGELLLACPKIGWQARA